MHDTKCFHAFKFDMKILVEENFILGIKILRDNDFNVLSQSHYVEEKKKIEHFYMWPMPIMYDLKMHLVKNCGDNVSQDK